MGSFAGADIEVVWPDLSDPLADYAAALEQALDSPLGTERLEQHVGPGAKVAIVVDDPSRWTPVREALPIVLRRLHAAGVGREDVTISVGVGRHHAVDADAMRRRRRRLRSPPAIAAIVRPLMTSPPMSTWARRRKECRCGFSGRWPRPTCGF